MGRGQTRAGRSKLAKNKRNRAAKPDPPMAQPNRLHRLMPCAGLRYPFPTSITRRKRQDARIMIAMAGFEEVSRNEVQSMAVQTFDIATEMIVFGDEPEMPADLAAAGASGVTISGAGTLSIGPVVFLRELFDEIIGREKKSQDGDQRQGWAFKLRFKAFAAFFPIVRSARLRWHMDPCHPFDIKNHCILAKSIDKFNQEAKRVDWVGLEMVPWLKEGGMMLDKDERGDAGGHGEDGPGDKGNRDESDDEMEAGKAEEDATKTGAENNDKSDAEIGAGKALLEQVIGWMKALSLDVSTETIEIAFAELYLG